jgi:hypothetical protein
MATVYVAAEFGLRASVSASAATILWGARGVSLNSTPSPRKASFTALKPFIWTATARSIILKRHRAKKTLANLAVGCK